MEIKKVNTAALPGMLAEIDFGVDGDYVLKPGEVPLGKEKRNLYREVRPVTSQPKQAARTRQKNQSELVYMNRLQNAKIAEIKTTMQDEMQAHKTALFNQQMTSLGGLQEGI